MLANFAQKIFVRHDDIFVNRNNDVAVFQASFFGGTAFGDASQASSNVCVFAANTQVRRTLRAFGDFFRFDDRDNHVGVRFKIVQTDAAHFATGQAFGKAFERFAAVG